MRKIGDLSCIASTIFGLVLILQASPAVAGSIKVNDGAGTCASLAGGSEFLSLGPPELSAQFSPARLLPNEYAAINVFTDYPLFSSNPVSETICREEVDYSFVNEPMGPPSGNTTQPPADSSLLRILYGKLRELLRRYNNWQNPDSSRKRQFRIIPGGAGGVRGSIDLGGANVIEASPDMMLSQVVPGTDDELLVPFIVENAGDGDWLSMSVDGTEFWRQPLSAFMAGELYFAVADGSLFSEESISALFVTLESVGAANASVFVADELTIIPIPAAAWLFGSALGLLGWMKRKA